MEASDVLVLPRCHGSGLPIKLLNYLSLGRAVVAAGCGAKVLIDREDGVVHFLYEVEHGQRLSIAPQKLKRALAVVDADRAPAQLFRG